MTGLYIRSVFKKIFHTNSIMTVVKRQRSTNIQALTSSQKDFVVRFMVEEDIPQIIQLRRSNTFHDSLSGYSIYKQVNPNSIIVLDDGKGKVIGLISSFINNGKLCTGGFRTIHEDYRQQSLTTKLTFPRLLEITDNRPMVVNVEVHLYQWTMKRFPVFEKDYVLLEFECLDEVNPSNLSSYIPQNVHIEEFGQSHLQDMLDYDHAIIGYNRKLLIDLNCQDVWSKTFIAYQEGKCVGYGTIKLDIQGCSKLGPLYADDPDIAEALLKKLLMSFELGRGFVATAPSNNAAAVRIIQKLGKMNTIINYRFYSKAVHLPETKNVYGLFDLEFEPF